MAPRSRQQLFAPLTSRETGAPRVLSHLAKGHQLEGGGCGTQTQRLLSGHVSCFYRVIALLVLRVRGKARAWTCSPVAHSRVGRCWSGRREGERGNAQGGRWHPLLLSAGTPALGAPHPAPSPTVAPTWARKHALGGDDLPPSSVFLSVDLDWGTSQSP